LIGGENTVEYETIGVFSIMLDWGIIWVVPAMAICLMFLSGASAILWMFRDGPIKSNRQEGQEGNVE
jgi:hypothetical protein